MGVEDRQGGKRAGRDIHGSQRRRGGLLDNAHRIFSKWCDLGIWRTGWFSLHSWRTKHLSWRSITLGIGLSQLLLA